MNIPQAIFLGIIEGLTEFLPVSSTFHQIFASRLLGVPQNDFTKLFEVFIQAGAILSVLLLYLKTFTRDHELLKKTLLAFVPTAIIGFVLYKVIKDVFFSSSVLMLSVFIGVGLLFILYEWYIKKHRKELHRVLDSFSYPEAVVVGLVQSFAVIPGVSRAGAVILIMMILRFRRDEAARFSFLLSVPTIFAASFFDMFKMRHLLTAEGSNMMLLFVGFVTAFFSSYLVVKWFIRYLQTHTLTGFGIYRVVIGCILFFFK